MATLDAGIIRVALPYLGEVFQVDPNTVAWLMLIYLLIGTGFMLALGQVGDTFGRKKLYTLGLLVFSIGLGLSSLSHSFTQLLIFRAIQSIGSAMIVANGYAILTASFPITERGRAIGIMGAVVGAGLLSGPALGGVLLDLLHWPAIFYIRAPIAIIASIMAWALLREPSVPKRTSKFDFAGAASIFTTMACLLLAVNRGQSLGWASPLVVGLGIGSIISFLLFLFTERKVAQPVVELSLYQSRLFTAASISHMMNYIGSAGVNFLLPFYLIQGLSFTPSVSGLILITIPVAYVVISPFAGRLSDKIGTLWLCTLGLAIVSIGIATMNGLDVNTSIIDIIWRLLIVGIGGGLFVAPNTSAIMGCVSKVRLGTASAMQATLRQIGMSLGIAIAGTVFTATQLSEATRLTNQGLSQEVVQSLSTVHGFHNAILVAMIFPAVGALISALRGRRTTLSDH